MISKTPDMVGRTGSVDLADITFSAKIDFVTIKTDGRVALPELQGKPKWSRQNHYKSLTVHDATPEDLGVLQASIGNARVLELEVAVDLQPRPAVCGTDRVRLLEAVMVDLFASELDPSDAKGMRNQFRAFYRRSGNFGKVHPFNLRLPRPTDQQLHGGRDDECQVKCYLKRTDQKSALAANDWRSRVEVRLSGQGLERRAVREIGDLFGFRFRKQLMPFFSHVKGSTRRRSLGKLAKKWQEPINQLRDRLDRAVFERHGVGALKDYKVPAKAVRLRRDTAVNNRIGQALTRLERQFRRQNIRAFSRKPDSS